MDAAAPVHDVDAAYLADSDLLDGADVGIGLSLVVLRVYVLALSAMLICLFVVMIRRSERLAATQPDGSLTSNVNMLAYIAVMIAVAQGAIVQIVRLAEDQGTIWYGSPVFAVWETILLVWCVQRARWHRGVEDSARMIQTNGDVV